MHGTRAALVAAMLAAGAASNAAAAGTTGTPVEEEMTLEQCQAEIARVRGLADALPASSLARVTVDAALNTARLEAEGGDVDECPTQIGRADAAAAHPAYVLRPGERLGMPEREMPVPRQEATPASPRDDRG